jgi:hypothetical protein
MDGTRSKPKLSGMSIDCAENGGYIVRHNYDNSNAGPSYMPSTQHVFANKRSLMGHIDRHMGGFKTAPHMREGLSTATSRPPSKKAGRKASHKRGAGVD